MKKKQLNSYCSYSKCATRMLASLLVAVLALLAKMLMPFWHSGPSFLWGCEVLVNPTRYPWTHLSSMSKSFNQPSCPFSHSRPMNTRCSSPFRRYCIHALATSSSSLSSFHPPVLQQRGLQAPSVSAYPHPPAAGCRFTCSLQPGTLQKGDILFGSCTSQRVFGLCDQVPGFKCGLVLSASQYLVSGWCFPHEEAVLWRQIDLRGLQNNKALQLWRGLSDLTVKEEIQHCFSHRSGWWY